ncbi:MAG: murein biosynthesis integral membrane protein MurJ [Desulfosarcina sp.]|nr:murein biosynthesis integral membrane protein MurJ [Desulfosarcina sp.]
MNSDARQQTKSENHNVTRAAGVVGAATLLSRIFGYVRDMVFASFFGAGMAADAFIAAFRIPNLLRRREDGLRLAVSALKLLLVSLSVIAIIGVVAAPIIIKTVAPGFSNPPEKMALTVVLTRIMFPYVILIGLVALCMGILNVMGHFAAPAIAPVLLNLAMIGSVFAVSRLSDSETVQVMGLAGGVLVGGVLQLALQLPYLVKHGIRFWKKSGLWHPGMRKVGLLMLPTIFGAAVYQINILVGTLLASLLPQGSVSYLYYADRLVQFPLGIFAQAAATAVLPSLSRQAANGDHAGLGDTFGHAMSLVLFITIPAMVGLIVLRDPIVALLFKRGAFDAQTTRLTSDALLYYALGLWAFSAVRIVVSTFYAMQDTRTPVIAATVSIVANILIGIALMGPMKHCGLALATSLASMVNLFILVVVLRKRLGMVRWRPIFSSCLRTLAASGMMALGVVMTCRILIPPETGLGKLQLLTGISAGVIGGSIIFFAAAWMMKIPEWRKVLGLMNRSLNRS